LNSIQRLQGLLAGLGFMIGFSAIHDMRGETSAVCDCRYGFSAGHNYRVDLKLIMFSGLVLNWPL